jgi:ABC-type Fe3+/spermidine/putrescine transport system ATPase subunit
MRDELRRLQRHLGLTALYVTHDQQEALAMSDQVVVMHGGRVLDVGSPREVYAAPKYRFTANFLGVANFLSGVVRERNGGDVTVETPAGRLTLLDRDASVGERVTLFFRPEDVRVVDASSPATGNRIAAHVEDAVYLGGVMDTRMVTISGSLTLRARFHPCEAPTTGSNVVLELRHGALSRIQENDDSQSALPTTDDHDMAPNDPGSPSSSALSA